MREQLLAAAALLFRRRGFDAVGIDDIGAAVGTSGPAVYRHFAGKHALLVEVIGSYLAALDAERHLRLARDDSREPILDAAIAVGQRLPDPLVTFHRETRELGTAARAELDTLGRSLATGWSALLAEHGVIPESTDAELRLSAVSGILLHLSLSRTGTKVQRADLTERLAGLTLDTDLPPLSAELDPVGATPIRHVTTREALLEAATALFQEQGFGRVSLREIGGEVGLSASAVSRHFESKDQLMAEISERATGQIAASISVALRTSASGEEATRKIIRRYVGIALDFRDLISITSTQLYSLPEPQRLSRLRNRRTYLDELAHTLSLARPDLAATECRLRAGATYSAINEVVMHPTLWRRAGVADALARISPALLLG